MNEMQTVDQELIAKWLGALESDEYEQGIGGLCCTDALGDSVYCPFGVLCNIVNPQGWGEPDKQGFRRFEDSSIDYPPLELLKRVDFEKIRARRLATLNDKRKLTFKDIATRIREGRVFEAMAGTSDLPPC